MAKVILTCGRICSGKTTYAKKLQKQWRAACLSVDEITLALFGQDAGEMHDTYVERLEKYLLHKSVELVSSGITVILDWGLWTRAKRTAIRDFYRDHQIPCEIHYIHLTDEEWHSRIIRRNRLVLEHRDSAYYVDEGLAAKAAAMFEIPSRSEVDVWLDVP